MDEERVFSLSYEQLIRFAKKRIRECNLDSQGVIYLRESAWAGAVLIFWHELAINGYASMELTDAGRAVAQPLLPASGLPADGTSATDLAVVLNGMTYQACRGDFVVRLDGSTCVCSYGTEKAGWYAGRAIRWKWRIGCRPVMMPE